MPECPSSYTPYNPKAVQELIQAKVDRYDTLQYEPLILYPWFLRPCTVRVLLVTDGALHFNTGDFGLSTFVHSLLGAGLPQARFQITVAHLRNDVSNADVMVGVPGIHNSIKNFVFDNPSHFTPTMYDQVWLFGFETYYHNSFAYPTRSSNTVLYPANRLGNQELQNLSIFMDNGGGLFATGDHGSLGQGLGGFVKRAQSMRLWASTNANINLDEVSMAGARRNDTNQLGDAGSQFDDQSDNIPQPIQPRLYRLGFSPFSSTYYPHPILCGPNGMIKVLPDHPHEGEVVVPSVLTNSYFIDGTDEYPVATGYTYRVRPEIIATSVVPAGNTSGGKNPTLSHTFGAIGAYDGHRAGVGRVVTDATWHHFVNINLIGVEGYPNTTPKGMGFLWDAAGLAHLANIKAYYVNTALWLSTPSLQTCFHKRLCWRVLHHEHVIESVVAHPQFNLRDLSDHSVIYQIGVHAHHSLCKLVPACQVRRFIIDIAHDHIPELAVMFDPWNPNPDVVFPPLTNWINPDALLDYVLGAALISFRDAEPYASEDSARRIENEPNTPITDGARYGIGVALNSFMNDLSIFTQLVGRTQSQLGPY